MIFFTKQGLFGAFGMIYDERGGFMAQKIDGRLAYADLLRAFATLAVILLHLAGSQMGAVAAGSAAWRTFNL